MLLFSLPTIVIVLVLLLLMQAAYVAGSRIYASRLKRDPSLKEMNYGTVEGALLGLLALLLAFSFSMSNSHYDRRIQVINEEVNAIGTAVLRADLYPDSIRSEFRKDFKEYVETRIEFYNAGVDDSRILAALQASAGIQDRLWKKASGFAMEPGYMVPSNQMIPALNDMFDIVTTRNTALQARIPEIIFYILFLLCIAASFTMGYTPGVKTDWIMNACFGIMIGLAVFLVIDLDRARRGLITVDFVNAKIVELRGMFEAGNKP